MIFPFNNSLGFNQRLHKILGTQRWALRSYPQAAGELMPLLAPLSTRLSLNFGLPVGSLVVGHAAVIGLRVRTTFALVASPVVRLVTQLLAGSRRGGFPLRLSGE